MQTLEDVCSDALTGNADLTVTVSTSLNEIATLSVEESQTIEDTLRFDPQIKVVHFKLRIQTETAPQIKDAFSVLMGAAKTTKDPLPKDQARMNGEMFFYCLNIHVVVAVILIPRNCN